MEPMSRVDIIARNGNDGLHYDNIPPPCHSFYPKRQYQRNINGCLDCVFIGKCVEATYRVKVTK